MFQADSEEAKMHQEFSQVKDEHFLALLKRRLWMLAFPGKLIPQAEDIVVRPSWTDDGCCGHSTFEFFVGQNVPGGIKGRTLDGWDAVGLVCDFFDVEKED